MPWKGESQLSNHTWKWVKLHSHVGTKFSTHNDLNWGSIIMTNILWTWFKFFKIKNWKEGFTTFIISFRMDFGKWVLNQMHPKLLSHLKLATFLVISNYNLIVNVMVVVKSSNNKQWPLDLFIKQVVIASMSLQTWWFGMKI
jgi:hypothetical protein